MSELFRLRRKPKTVWGWVLLPLAIPLILFFVIDWIWDQWDAGSK